MRVRVRMDRRALRAAAAVGSAPDRMDFVRRCRRAGTSGWSMPAPATAPVADGDPALCLFVGVDCGRERARLLDAGCGDALPADVGLPELAQRARRVAAAGARLPRLRAAGPLTLDLLHRDARAGRALARAPSARVRAALAAGRAARRAGLARDAAARGLAARVRARDQFGRGPRLAPQGQARARRDPRRWSRPTRRRLSRALLSRLNARFRRTVRAAALCPAKSLLGPCARFDSTLPTGRRAGGGTRGAQMSEAHSAGAGSGSHARRREVPARPAVHALPHPAAGDLLAGHVLRRARLLADLLTPCPTCATR